MASLEIGGLRDVIYTVGSVRVLFQKIERYVRVILKTQMPPLFFFSQSSLKREKKVVVRKYRIFAQRSRASQVCVRNNPDAIQIRRKSDPLSHLPATPRYE